MSNNSFPLSFLFRSLRARKSFDTLLCAEKFWKSVIGHHFHRERERYIRVSFERRSGREAETFAARG